MSDRWMKNKSMHSTGKDIEDVKAYANSVDSSVDRIQGDIIRLATAKWGPGLFASSVATQKQADAIRSERAMYAEWTKWRDAWKVKKAEVDSSWIGTDDRYNEIGAYENAANAWGKKWRDLYAAYPTAASVDGSSTSSTSKEPASFEGSDRVKTETTSMTSSKGPSGGGIAVSSEVEVAQKILTALGFDTKGIDGKLGDKTRAAIKAFQQKNGLPVTSSLDAATMAKLRSMAPASLAASLGGQSAGMSTGMKIGLAVAGVAAVGGLAYYFLSDDEEEGGVTE